MVAVFVVVSVHQFGRPFLHEQLGLQAISPYVVQLVVVCRQMNVLAYPLVVGLLVEVVVHH